MIQLWINLPKKDKYTDPKYQEIKNEDMGKIELANESGQAVIIAGEFKGVKGPASTFSPMNIYTLDLKAGGSIEIDEPGDFNTGILIISGDLEVNKTKTKENDFILFENKDGLISIDQISSDSKILVLSGQSLNETAIARGPFVMNSKEELDKAMLDYREGNFGMKDF